MASVKIHLHSSKTKKLDDGTFLVYLRITHKQKRKYIGLNKHCTKEQWNKETSRFRKNYPNHKQENKVLLAIESRATHLIDTFAKEGIPFTFKIFTDRFLKREKSIMFSDYINNRIEQLKIEKKISTSENYKTTRNGVIDFTKQSNDYDFLTLKLTDIDYVFLQKLESWYRAKREASNSGISVRMRDIRALMNRAIKEKLIKRDAYPFDQYKISALNKPTKKRAIDKDTIVKIKDLTFQDYSRQQLAQNIFLFSFYTRGMNFVDIAQLTKANLYGDRIEYTRQKTRSKVKNVISVKLLPPAKEILEFYMNDDTRQSEYIFPILDSKKHISPTQQYNRRKRVLKQVNSDLKDIAKMIGMDDLKLTTYVSRHSYATILKKADVPIAVISEALGHQDIRVTETYLKNFEHNVLDKADQHIL